MCRWKSKICTQDADSEAKDGEKKEGAFYMWTEAEIDEVVGPERAPLFKEHYFVRRGGNCVLSAMSDPHKEFAGLNCLIERQPLATTAETFGAGSASWPQPCKLAHDM